MTIKEFKGDEVSSILLDTQDIKEYNSIRYFVDGKEILPSQLSIYIYNDEEQEPMIEEILEILKEQK